MTEPESTGQEHKRDGKGRWRKGQSGNPAGRPAGARHRATIAAECLLDGQAEALTARAVEMALDGDGMALRLCLERILPSRKDRPVSLALPPIITGRDAATASAMLVKSVSSGEITPSEAANISKLVDATVKAIEVQEIERRLIDLERKFESGK